SLRINTKGFWKEVLISTFDSNIIRSKSVQTKGVALNSAELHLEVQFLDYFKGKIQWKSGLFGNEIMEPKGTSLHRTVTVDNPKLWWPKGQGNQELYEDEWFFYDEKNQLIAKQKVIFGIRTSRLIQEKDEIGTSYVIEVNGRPIFCKGGDYIPQDVFPARVSDAQIVDLVEDMAKANYNMVRVWGGGYYPDEVFYETCDRLGLMVWQDFMFACAMYPGDTSFLENVREEFDYQIPRISSHPSVVLFNGNNEVDVAWKNWGFQAKYLIFGKEAEIIEPDYKKLFQTLLPERIELFTDVPYIHTSPLSNWGKTEYYNQGSQHYWGVWHGKDPIEDFDKKSGRFNAEYGFQSFPQMSTISMFAAPSDWNLESEVMKNHQKSYVGNQMIGKQTKRLYGEPSDFENFVYLSQLTQAKAVGIAISSHRIQAPRCMGTLYWQVNDVWPAPTWSSIDYYGNWKALHYQVKKDFEDIAILEKTEELGKEKYFLVSSSPETKDVRVLTTVYDLQGKKLFEDFSMFEVQPQSSFLVGENLYSAEFQSKDFVVEFEIKSDQKYSRSFAHLVNNRKIATKDQVKFKLEYNEVTGKGELIIENKEFIHQFMVFSTKNGIRFENNLLELLPGIHKLEFESKTTPTLDDFDFKWL
ncbi:MAG: hypothetical protein KJ941_00940, partial [Bacteroidetes bacterium]|nr:hypothetical protein [Bacteroidota bacterium]